MRIVNILRNRSENIKIFSKIECDISHATIRYNTIFIDINREFFPRGKHQGEPRVDSVPRWKWISSDIHKMPFCAASTSFDATHVLLFTARLIFQVRGSSSVSFDDSFLCRLFSWSID